MIEKLSKVNHRYFFKRFIAVKIIYFEATKKPRYKILLGVTGSGAAIKIPEIIQSLNSPAVDAKEYGLELHVIITRSAKHFLKLPDIQKRVAKVYDDDMMLKGWDKSCDQVVHVELTKLADVMIIAPLNSDTMGKLANGICNNLLCLTVRTWDMKKPLLFCPAMNVKMWNHPITEKYVTTLKKWGYIEVPPVSKKLMCGDVGVGAMASVPNIVGAILKVTDEKFKEEKNNRTC